MLQARRAAWPPDVASKHPWLLGAHQNMLGDRIGTGFRVKAGSQAM